MEKDITYKSSQRATNYLIFGFLSFVFSIFLYNWSDNETIVLLFFIVGILLIVKAIFSTKEVVVEDETYGIH